MLTLARLPAATAGALAVNGGTSPTIENAPAIEDGTAVGVARRCRRATPTGEGGFAAGRESTPSAERYEPRSEVMILAATQEAQERELDRGRGPSS